MQVRYEIGIVESRMFAENCYVLHLIGRDDCVVVDPGLDPAEIVDYLRSRKLHPAAILNTHGHADHIAGNATLKAAWPKTSLVIGAKDAFKLTDPNGNLSAQFGIPITSPAADRLLRDGDKVSFAGIELEVLETPGHSSGHIVFVWKEPSPWIVFGGDVLFQGSIGRTDLPDGSFDELESSIRTKLYSLPDETLILPGHGPQTTIGIEKRTNPFVNEI